MPLSTQGPQASLSTSTMSDPRTCTPNISLKPSLSTMWMGPSTMLATSWKSSTSWSNMGTIWNEPPSMSWVLAKQPLSSDTHGLYVEHNPEIDWSTRKVSMTRCLAACGPNATADGAN